MSKFAERAARAKNRTQYSTKQISDLQGRLEKKHEEQRQLIKAEEEEQRRLKKAAEEQAQRRQLKEREQRISDIQAERFQKSGIKRNINEYKYEGPFVSVMGGKRKTRRSSRKTRKHRKRKCSYCNEYHKTKTTRKTRKMSGGKRKRKTTRKTKTTRKYKHSIPKGWTRASGSAGDYFVYNEDGEECEWIAGKWICGDER